jgi:hypothetical protein
MTGIEIPWVIGKNWSKFRLHSVHFLERFVIVSGPASDEDTDSRSKMGFWVSNRRFRCSRRYNSCEKLRKAFENFLHVWGWFSHLLRLSYRIVPPNPCVHTRRHCRWVLFGVLNGIFGELTLSFVGFVAILVSGYFRLAFLAKRA